DHHRQKIENNVKKEGFESPDGTFDTPYQYGDHNRRKIENNLKREGSESPDGTYDTPYQFGDHHRQKIEKNSHREVYEFLDGNNILDLVITSDPARVFRVALGPLLGFTEKDGLHATLSWNYELRTAISTPSEFSRPVLNRGNYELFSTLVNASIIALDKDVNVAYDEFVKTYAAASCMAIPNQVHRARKRANPKWFNANIKQLTKKKFTLHCRIRSAPRNSELRLLYVTVCKQVKTTVRNAIFKFEASIVRACKLQPKLLYNYINSQKQCRDSVKGLLDLDGTFHTDGVKIANILNVQFGSVFIPRQPCLAKPLQPMSCTQQEVDIKVFSPENVRKYILRLNPRKSPGMDSIHPFVVKSCADAFSEVLSVIFTSSYSSCKIPDAWRLAQISP
ncbi:RNA-directed DNA polymerase from mobile element jockey-like, partial [Brachionus plicatilis]